MKALILVDIQVDFTRKGKLEVPNGDDIIPVVNELQQHFDLVLATQDWHPPDHKSFASMHPGKKVFENVLLNGLPQVLWPDHCVQGSSGAEFHPSLNMTRVESIIRKGMDPEIDSYSGFFDNGHRKSTGLGGYLRERRVNALYVCGLAGDFCVFFTVKDAIGEGFQTTLIEDATRSISEEAFKNAKSEIRSLGGFITQSSQLNF
jgi:nicotinamidase/pyrazinamidase